MYARIVSGQAHRERNALHLEQGATVDTNTYFGRLPASYFQRWTTADEVQLKLVFDTSTRGPGAASRLRHPRRRQEPSTAPRSTAPAPRADGPAQRVRRRRRVVDGVHARSAGPLTITDLEWTVAAPADDPARRDRHLHVQPGRRLRDQRRGRRGRQGSACGHRRDLRRRPGHRRRRDPSVVQRRRRTTRRQARLPAAAEPRWCGRLFAGHVRDLQRRRPRERDPDG